MVNDASTSFYLRNLSASYRRKAVRRLDSAQRAATKGGMDSAERLTDSAERLVVAADACERMARQARRVAA